MIRLVVDSLTTDEAERFVQSADVLGTDGHPLKSNVRLCPPSSAGDPHTLEITTSEEQAVAIRGLFPAGSVGSFVQSTCLLPAGGTGLSLSVEMARGRVRDFLLIGEDWQFFQDPDAQEAMQAFDKARTAFTEAVLAGDASTRRKRAGQAIERGIDSSERLSVSYAESSLKRRNPKSLPIMGLVANLSQSPEVMVAAAGGARDGVLIPLSRAMIEKSPGTYDFAAVDRWMQYAFQASIPVTAGPLLDARPNAMPPSVEALRDLSEVNESVDLWVHTVLQRYGGGVRNWILGTDLNRYACFGLDIDSRVDLLLRVGAQLRSLVPQARCIVECTAPWNDRLQSKSAVPLIPFVLRLSERSVTVHCLAIHVAPTEGTPLRDLLQLAGLSDRLRSIKIPLLVTRLGVPASIGGEERSGWWRKPWDSTVQAAWARRAIAVLLCRPWVHGIFWNADGNAIACKETFAQVGAIRKVLAAGVARAKLAGETKSSPKTPRLPE
ncbi:MAG: hypothetical protein O2800_05745 [Planctomycetota bacterium]|nr:hypothetical protein [Planctomycetota bacterium]